jgi:DNA polymerase III alpha subunit
MQESGALNRATLEALIQAGAFESLHPNRAQLLNGLDAILSYAQSVARAKAAGQNSLFEGGAHEEVAVAKPALTLVDDLPTPQKLALERELLGVYLSDHPIRPYQRVLAGKVTPIAQAMEREGATLTIGGIITSIQTRVSKKTGARMAILQVEDLTGAIRVAVFANTYEQYRDALQKDRVVLIRGRTPIQRVRQPQRRGERRAGVPRGSNRVGARAEPRRERAARLYPHGSVSGRPSAPPTTDYRKVYRRGGRARPGAYQRTHARRRIVAARCANR